MRGTIFALLLFFSTLANAIGFGAVPNVGKEISSDSGCSCISSGYSGTLLIRGFSTISGSIDLSGNQNGGTGTNNFTALETPDLKTTTTNTFIVNNSSITFANFPQLTKGNVDLKYNPLTQALFPVLAETKCHLYLSHNSTLTNAVTFPKLVTMTGALVFSGDTGITAIGSSNLPVLTTVNHQLEIDGMTNLVTVHLDTVTTVGGTLSVCGPDQSGVIIGGDTALTTFTMDAPGLSWAGLLDADTTGITTFSMAGLTTLVNGFYFKQTRWHLSVGAVNAWLVQLKNVAVASGVTSGTIDLRFQQPSGAAPTGLGAAAKTTLQGLGITVLTD